MNILKYSLVWCCKKDEVVTLTMVIPMSLSMYIATYTLIHIQLFNINSCREDVISLYINTCNN